jgi:hypothetical protein
MAFRCRPVSLVVASLHFYYVIVISLDVLMNRQIFVVVVLLFVSLHCVVLNLPITTLYPQHCVLYPVGATDHVAWAPLP